MCVCLCVAQEAAAVTDSVMMCGKGTAAVSDSSRPVFNVSDEDDTSDGRLTSPAADTASAVRQDTSKRDGRSAAQVTEAVAETAAAAGDSVRPAKCQPLDTAAAAVATPVMHKSASKYAHLLISVILYTLYLFKILPLSILFIF